MTPRVLLASVDTAGLSQAAQEALAKVLPPAPVPAPSFASGAIDHEVTIGGKPVRYRASTGTMPVRDEAGKLKAELFFVAYERLGVDSSATRPITFAFNGGPGSSSVWLHLGALGPRRVKFGDDGEGLPPPGALVDNEWSWLDATDLVFIDPVSTGFSRPAQGEDAQQFHDLDGDIKAVGEFIRLYATRHERWLSPKFIVGESYGATRAAGLAAHLQREHGLYVNGVILVSPALDFATLAFDDTNELPFWLTLPTYTATAWYHKKLAPDLQRDLAAALAESEAFAGGEYLVAIAKGNRLGSAEFSVVAAKLARLTGLAESVVRRARLRIKDTFFFKELLRDQGRTVGRLDSRYTGIDRDGVGAAPDYDPSYAVIMGPYTAALNSYMREELRLKSDMKYEILSEKANIAWNFRAKDRYPATTESLRIAMTENPALRVMVCNGYYDIATTYFASDYTMSHLGLDESLRQHVRIERYHAGHMMYVRAPDLRKFKEDAASFVAQSI